MYLYLRLFGDNGILNQAVNSADKTNVEKAREKIALEVVGSYDESGKLNMDSLKENLEKNLGVDTSNIGDSLPTGTVELDGYKFYINQNEEVVHGIGIVSEGDLTLISTPNTWTNQNVETSIVNNNENYQVVYSKNMKDWTNYTVPIISEENETLYIKLTDGINDSEIIEKVITNIDKNSPQEAEIILSGEGTVTTSPAIKATVKHIDEESGVNMQNSKWVLTTQSTNIGLDPNSYTGGTFSSNDQEISANLSEQGNYYFHILTIDEAGNSKETVSPAISMIVNRHNHTGNSTSGGGCYVSVPHTVTKQCNEKVSMTREGNQWDTGSCMAGGVAGYCSKGHKVTGQVTWGYGTSWTGSVQGTCTATYIETVYAYELGCGMEENQILSYTISY